MFLLFIFWLASNGSSAHLLKVGSKRRRTQADMKDQLKVEELSQALEEEKDDKIAKLEAELKAAKNYAGHTQEAANILAGLIDAGELKVNEDNTV